VIEPDDDPRDRWTPKGTIVVDLNGATVAITVTPDDAIRVASTPRLFDACAAVVDAAAGHCDMAVAIQECQTAVLEAERFAAEHAQAPVSIDIRRRWRG
jgi:hypothetical protein